MTISPRVLDVTPVFPQFGFAQFGGVLAAARSGDPGLKAAALLRIDQWTGNPAVSDALIADTSRQNLKYDNATIDEAWANPMTIMEGYDWDGDLIWRMTSDWDMYGPGANNAFPPMLEQLLAGFKYVSPYEGTKPPGPFNPIAEVDIDNYAFLWFLPGTAPSPSAPPPPNTNPPPGLIDGGAPPPAPPPYDPGPTYPPGGWTPDFNVVIP